MVLDGALGEVEARRDLGVGQPVGDQAPNFELATRQRAGRSPGRTALDEPRAVGGIDATPGFPLPFCFRLPQRFRSGLSDRLDLVNRSGRVRTADALAQADGGTCETERLGRAPAQHEAADRGERDAEDCGVTGRAEHANRSSEELQRAGRIAGGLRSQAEGEEDLPLAPGVVAVPNSVEPLLEHRRSSGRVAPVEPSEAEDAEASPHALRLPELPEEVDAPREVALGCVEVAREHPAQPQVVDARREDARVAEQLGEIGGFAEWRTGRGVVVVGDREMSCAEEPERAGAVRLEVGFEQGSDPDDERSWTNKQIYLLPSATFRATPESRELVSEQPVRPRARLPVTPADFPFRAQTRGHRQGESVRSVVWRNALRMPGLR